MSFSEHFCKPTPAELINTAEDKCVHRWKRRCQQKDTCSQEMNSMIAFVPGAKKLSQDKDYMGENSEVNVLWFDKKLEKGLFTKKTLKSQS